MKGDRRSGLFREVDWDGKSSPKKLPSALFGIGLLTDALLVRRPSENERVKVLSEMMLPRELECTDTSARRQAFTLIETLIVLTIIAIIAALLFPVFVRARQKALVAVCQSNLKQIGAGLKIYADDYDGFLPIAWRYPENTDVDDPFSIATLLLPYVPDKNVYIDKATDRQFWQQRRISYLYAYGALMFQQPWEEVHHLTDFEQASETIVLRDMTTEERPRVHMDAGVNNWFLDGHVKLLTAE